MPETDTLAASMILIRRAQAGDKDAFNDLLKRYSGRVLQIVRMRLGPGLRAKLESQDILQDAFTRAFHDFDHFELQREGAFLHWLSELVRHSICDRYDHFKAEKRSAAMETPLDRPADDSKPGLEPRGGDPSPSRILAGQEELEKLTRALDRLSEEHRDVIVSRDIEDLSFAEIGALLSRSEDAARMLYSRAKAKLAMEYAAK